MFIELLTIHALTHVFRNLLKIYKTASFLSESKLEHNYFISFIFKV